MITDILLAPDVVLEACTKEDSSVSSALSKAKREGVKTWLYVGCVDRVHAELSTYLKTTKGLTQEKALKEASRLLLAFSKDHHWLSALSEDGYVLHSPYPIWAQLFKALERLGEKALILSKERDLLPFKTISPEDYLKLSVDSLSSIPFVNLEKQQDLIRHDVEKNIFHVLRHGRYVDGPEIAKLEKRLEEEVGVKHAIACSSGTDALFMALLALDIGPGDAVLTVPFTFIATAEVIRLVGAIPIFVDIDPETFTMDPKALENTLEAISGKRSNVFLPSNVFRLRPRAIITVDLFGCPASYDEIFKIAKSFDLFIIEDAAQAFGAIYRGKPAGSLGDIGCTSFFPAKPLGAYGDGGAIFTNSDSLAKRLRLIRNHGTDGTLYYHKIIGINGRLDSIQAAVLLAKLKIFQEEKERRRHIASLYTQKLSTIYGITTPKIPEGIESAWSQYSILTPSRALRDKIREGLSNLGIPTAIYYPRPLHLQPAFQDLGYKPGDFPISETCSEKILSLPMHPYVEGELIEKIRGSIYETLSSHYLP
ncbi:MAG: DegT/DnrJ/EryC1/StrS family aminotransferase [Syntrophobacterales bacterium]|nr:DegT/DnrJ/EryC1/StrS family aminotransferase [Syntrophobacterales bacterium]